MFQRPTAESQLIAGERLRAILFAEVLEQGQAFRNAELSEQLVRLGADRLYTVAVALPLETLPLLLMLLEPRRAAELLKLARSRNKERFDILVKALAQQPPEPGPERRSQEDALKAAISGELAGIQPTAVRHIGYLKELMEQTGDDVSEDIVNRLGTGNAEISAAVSESYIGLGTFFKLRRDLQTEIMEYLSTRDIAALMLAVNDSQKSMVSDLAGERRRALLDEEVNRIKSRGRRNEQAAVENAKRVVVARIREMRGSGSINDMLETADQTGQRNPGRAA